MPCSVLQKNPETPSLEQLKRAFRHVPGLTEYDANLLGRDAFGILGQGLSPEAASAMKQAFAAEGVATEVIPDTKLPPLPDTFFLSRIDCATEGLLLYDSLGRIAELPWSNILLIAAGMVPLSEFKDVRTGGAGGLGLPGASLPLPGGLGGGLGNLTGGGGPAFSDPVQYELKEEHHDRMLLEIILIGGTIRYSLNSAKAPLLLFAGLGERRTRNPLQNLALLVQDLIQGAPQSAINRGAERLRQNDLSFKYPGKTAFFHEIVWLLWQKSVNS